MNDYSEPWEHSFRLFRWFLITLALSALSAILNLVTAVELFDRLFYLFGAATLVLLVATHRTRHHARELFKQSRLSHSA